MGSTPMKFPGAGASPGFDSRTAFPILVYGQTITSNGSIATLANERCSRRAPVLMNSDLPLRLSEKHILVRPFSPSLAAELKALDRER